MKKRILSALLAIMLCIVSVGVVGVSAAEGDLILSDTTTLSKANTDTCFAKPTGDEYHTDSNYYMHFKSTGDWLEVAQNLTEGVVAGGQYVLTVVAKPVSGTVWFRVGWDDTGWLTSGQVDLATDIGDGWFRYEKNITLTANQSNLLFHNDGAAEIYVDSISLKPVDEDKELLPNSGFDSVAYDSATGVITANETSVNVSNTDAVFAEMQRVALDAENEYSLHFKTTADDWFEVTQNLTETATAGSQYVFTAYVKPVTGNVWFYIDWDATGWMATHAADIIAPQPDGWTMIQKTITMTEDKAKLLFHNDGATEMYIDDISLVPVGGTENLIPDGGFGEVTVEGGEEPPVVEPEEPSEDIPDENLTLSETTRVSANADNCYARVTDNEKNSGSYSLHFYTEGDWLEIAQDYTSALAAGTYTLTWYAKGTGRVWFYSNWGTEFAATHAVDSAVEQSNGWTKYTRTIAIDGDGDTSFLFHGEGAVDQYIDDISLVDANGVDYIIDGGFEEVTVAGAHEHTWDEGVVTQEPTTEAEGVKTYTCSGCGETYTEAIEKLPEPEEPSVDIDDEYLVLSGTTHINVTNTDAIFAKVTDNEKAGGSYSLHFKSSGDWLEVDQTLLETAVTGGKYIVSASVKGVSGRVWFRFGWDDDAWMAVDQSSTGTDLGNGWIRVTKEVTIKGNEGDITKLLFHSDGATEAYIDDISVKAAGSDVELMPDGGFEEVTVNTPAEDIDDERLVLSGTTHVNEANTDVKFAKVTDNEKNSGSYSLHVKSGGDWLEVDQTLAEELVAGNQYVITAYIKAVTGKVWFRLGWDTTGWMVSTQEGTVQDNGWTKIERTITLTGDDIKTKLLFHNDGATEMYIDDISVKAVGSDVELMPDGGFEEVTVLCEEHTWDEGVETLAPTCVTDGSKTVTCSVCGATNTVSIPATGEHAWGEGVVTVAPTVDAEGTMTYTCTVCGTQKTEAIDKLEPSVDIDDEYLVLSGTTHINVTNTDAIFAKVTDNEKAGGSYSLHFKSSGDWLEVDQTLLETAVTGGKYIVSASVKGVSGRVWFRLGWDDDAWMAVDQSATGTDLGNGWIRVTKEVTIKGNEGDITKLLFHSDGATEAYIDDISVKAVGSDVELMPDGGFEEVTVNTPAEDIDDERLVLSGTTHVNEANTDVKFAKVTDNEKNSGSYSLHVKSGGDWLEVDQTLAEELVAGNQYVITAYIKAVTGTVWFRLGWDATGWMVSTQEGTVQDNGWTKIERTITLTGDDIKTKLLFHNDGATEMYIDDISVKAVGSDVELMPDGGFEEVTVLCEEHTWDASVETKAPTCTENGANTTTCSVCGFKKTDAIPATGHSMTFKAEVPATCAEAGTKAHYACSVCGKNFEDEAGATELIDLVIPATGEHAWGEGVVTVAPTVDAEGVMTYTCTVCGGQKTEAIDKLPAPTHTPGDANNDGAINVKDVIISRQFCVGGYDVEDKIVEAAADVDGDGEVTARDLVRLRQYIAGGYGVELK